MVKEQQISGARVAFVFAFFIRIPGIALTNLTSINPDQGKDTSTFAEAAQSVATGNVPAEELIDVLGPITTTWGVFLSPFWFLPGPSELYAQFFMALLGSFAIYNVYLIVSQYHSNQAAWFAVVPLIALPSFVALHSVILRDAAILAGFTYAIRLFVVPVRWEPRIRYRLALITIGLTSLLRLENLPIYAVMFGTAIILRDLPKKYYVPGGATAGFLALTSYPAAKRVFQWLGLLADREGVFNFLLFMREARIREGGRTQYLADIVIQTPLDILLYAPISAVHFLFVPFPWMAETAIDYIVVVESLILLIFAIAALRGAVWLASRDFRVTVALLLGLFLYVVFYGIISVNVGTTVRHRQTFTWVLFALGGIELARQYDVTVSWRDRGARDSPEIAGSGA